MAPASIARSACGAKRNSSLDGTYYLVTIKRNAMDFTSMDDLKQMYHSVKDSMKNVSAEWSSFVGYELDSRRRLHLHTYISTKRKLYFPKYGRAGWTIHFKEVPEDAVADVIRYISKCNQNKYYLENLEVVSQLYYQDEVFF